jgi:hypothetical protein
MSVPVFRSSTAPHTNLRSCWNSAISHLHPTETRAKRGHGLFDIFKHTWATKHVGTETTITTPTTTTTTTATIITTSYG